MLIRRAAFSGHEVIHIVDIVKVGTFGVGNVSALINDFRLADKFFFGCGIFLQGNAIEIMMIYALIPVHIYQIFFPAGVMEQGGIKAGAVQEYRF